MKVSQKGVDLIKSFEGKGHTTGYICPAGVPTIGYGHTGKVNGVPVKKGMKITARQVNDLLLEDLVDAENAVNKYTKYRWTQNEFDALVSFAYNVGSIDKLTTNGLRTKTVISEKILAYNKANGVVLKGLVRRRAAEKALFDKK